MLAKSRFEDGVYLIEQSTNGANYELVGLVWADSGVEIFLLANGIKLASNQGDRWNRFTRLPPPQPTAGPREGVHRRFPRCPRPSRHLRRHRPVLLPGRPAGRGCCGGVRDHVGGGARSPGWRTRLPHSAARRGRGFRGVARYHTGGDARSPG